MAAKFARERMVQIYKDANFKPSTVVRLFFVLIFLSLRVEFWHSSSLIALVLSKRVAPKAVNLERLVKYFYKSNKNLKHVNFFSYKFWFKIANHFYLFPTCMPGPNENTCWEQGG